MDGSGIEPVFHKYNITKGMEMEEPHNIRSSSLLFAIIKINFSSFGLPQG